MEKFEKETRHWLNVFIRKKTTVNSAKCETTERVHEAFCPLTQAWRVNCHFNCPITLSNYKHNAYTFLLVFKSGDNQSCSRSLVLIKLFFTLQILGDKLGWFTASHLSTEVGRDLLKQLEDKFNVSAKFIHVVRNPFDNISTMALRLRGLRTGEHTKKVSRVQHEFFILRTFLFRTLRLVFRATLRIKISFKSRLWLPFIAKEKQKIWLTPQSMISLQDETKIFIVTTLRQIFPF